MSKSRVEFVIDFLICNLLCGSHY